MIDLATRGNEREIKIKVTGLRPGEKLYEELLVDANTSEETTHQKICKSLERGPSLEIVREQLLLLDVALNEQNLDLVLTVLHELVEGYSENSLASN
jgi:FlaA1/EpsC-like NDP-sugar epimerase